MKINSLIQRRYLMSFGFALASIVVMALFSINEIGKVAAALSDVNHVNSVKQRYAINFRGSVHDRAISLRDVSLVTDDGELRSALSDIKRLETDYATSAGPLDAMFAGAPADSKDMAILKQIKAVEAKTMPLVTKVIAAREAGKLDEARTLLLTQARPAFVEWLRDINKFIDFQEARNNEIGAVVDAVVSRFSLLTLGLGLLTFAMSAGFAVWNVRALQPLRTLTQVMLTLSEGDLRGEVPAIARKDEIGTMAGAVQVFKDSMIRSRTLEDEANAARAGAETQRKAVMREMAERFGAAIGGIVTAVSSSASGLQATARTMAGAASETAHQSTSVAAAAEEAATNVTMVASAAEELGSSVQEIGRQVSGSAGLAQLAVSEADMTARLVQELSHAASKIGDVVGLISNIAGQTNLLALNATIEAARAGEAGRGFAVVAAEVKELASQTAKATGEISQQIGQIQDVTGQAVTAIGSIMGRIREINTLATGIAESVQQQGAATQEIVRNVAQAATGTGEVTATITGVAHAAGETGAAAKLVLDAASELSHQSEHLDAEVNRFLNTVRAA